MLIQDLKRLTARCQPGDSNFEDSPTRDGQPVAFKYLVHLGPSGSRSHGDSPFIGIDGHVLEVFEVDREAMINICRSSLGCMTTASDCEPRDAPSGM